METFKKVFKIIISDLDIVSNFDIRISHFYA